jgi:hypothetical protein
LLFKLGIKQPALSIRARDADDHRFPDAGRARTDRRVDLVVGARAVLVAPKCDFVKNGVEDRPATDGAKTAGRNGDVDLVVEGKAFCGFPS